MTKETEDFPSNPEDIQKANEIAQQLVKEIMDNARSKYTLLPQDDLEVKAPGGKGLRFQPNGQLNGFIEPYNTDVLSFLKHSDLDIVNFSDWRYEILTMEIHLKGGAIAQINQEKGPENLEIELVTAYHHKKARFKCPLNDFVAALEFIQGESAVI